MRLNDKQTKNLIRALGTMAPNMAAMIGDLVIYGTQSTKHKHALIRLIAMAVIHFERSGATIAFPSIPFEKEVNALISDIKKSADKATIDRYFSARKNGVQQNFLEQLNLAVSKKAFTPEEMKEFMSPGFDVEVDWSLVKEGSLKAIFDAEEVARGHIMSKMVNEGTRAQTFEQGQLRGVKKPPVPPQWTKPTVPKPETTKKAAPPLPKPVEDRKKAATTIQKAVRGMQAKKQLKELKQQAAVEKAKNDKRGGVRYSSPVNDKKPTTTATDRAIDPSQLSMKEKMELFNKGGKKNKF